MVEKFDLSLRPIKYYVRFQNDDVIRAIIDINIVNDGVKFSQSFLCSDYVINQLINASDQFVSGKITEADRLWLKHPHIVNGVLPFFFDMYPASEHDGEHWVFHFVENPYIDDMKEIYSCDLGKNLIEKMGLDLDREYKDFDWENAGKTEYYKFGFPDIDYKWYYSASEFSNDVKEMVLGHKLQNIYVSALNYAAPLRVENNFVNYYLGSQLILEFDDIFLDILAIAEGLFQMRVLYKSGYQVMLIRHTGFPDYSDDYCITGYMFTEDFHDSPIIGVNSEPTEYWPWSPKSFDESKVPEPAALPKTLALSCENNNVITIGGWDDDFYIRIDQKQ